MNERLIFDTDSDPGLQVVTLATGGLSFSNNDDWCGDTESGFGATVAIELKHAQVEALHVALGLWLASRA